MTECHPYGEGVVNHRRYLEQLTGRSNPMPAVSSTYADWVVCINCAEALNQALGTHDGCLCRELAAQALRDYR